MSFFSYNLFYLISEYDIIDYRGGETLYEEEKKEESKKI